MIFRLIQTPSDETAHATPLSLPSPAIRVSESSDLYKVGHTSVDVESYHFIPRETFSQVHPNAYCYGSISKIFRNNMVGMTFERTYKYGQTFWSATREGSLSPERSL